MPQSDFLLCALSTYAQIVLPSPEVEFYQNTNILSQASGKTYSQTQTHPEFSHRIEPTN